MQEWVEEHLGKNWQWKRRFTNNQAWETFFTGFSLGVRVFLAVFTKNSMIQFLVKFICFIFIVFCNVGVTTKMKETHQLLHEAILKACKQFLQVFFFEFLFFKLQGKGISAFYSRKRTIFQYPVAERNILKFTYKVQDGFSC